MPHYLKRGAVPRKRHIAFPNKPGYKNEGIYYEEVVTRTGFCRAYGIVYHLRPPTRVTKVEPAGEAPIELAKETALRHVHLKSGNMPLSGDPINGRIPLLVNDDVAMSRCRPAQRQIELFRNATCDEVVFVHKGKGTLHTMFGPLPFKPFDYVVVPRCTTYRFEF